MRIYADLRAFGSLWNGTGAANGAGNQGQTAVLCGLGRVDLGRKTQRRPAGVGVGSQRFAFKQDAFNVFMTRAWHGTLDIYCPRSFFSENILRSFWGR